MTNAMLVISSPMVLSFVTVKAEGALVVVATWLPKLILGGAMVKAGGVPFPDMVTSWGKSASAVVTRRRPGWPVPADAGVKVTLIVQAAPIARVAGLTGQVFVWPKLTPPTTKAMLAIVSVVVPVLVSVTGCDGLVVVTS